MLRAPLRREIYSYFSSIVAASIALILLYASAALAVSPAPLISRVEIAGNQRVETDAILLHIESKPGLPLDPAMVDRDIKAIYRMGFFDFVTAHEEQQGANTILIFDVRERPLITDVRFGGMKALKPNEDSVINAVKLHGGSILDPGRVQATIQNLKVLYQDKGYLDAGVTFRTVPEPQNTAIGVFDVVEGPIVTISSIKFVGNKHLSSSALMDAITTHQHNWLSFFFKTGILDQKKLLDDVDRITGLYYDEGYLNAHVADPVVKRHGNSLTVTFYIDEGPQYHVGVVNVAGDLRVPQKDLLKQLTLKPGSVFSGTTMQHDVLTLSDFYSNKGYAYVNVDPRTQIDPAARTVNVNFNINPGREVVVDRINITGNTKTSDKVIRRELAIQEQEPYSTSKIQQSKRRLDSLGYFSNTRITTTPGPSPDKIDLDIAVQEANTASLQIGGGYDSYTSVFGNFSIGNSNLFGGGESVSADAQIGFLYQDYSLNYTEPWFLDIPLSVSPSLSYEKLYLFSFNQTNAGFALNTTYPLSELGFEKIGPFSLDNTTAGLGYQFQSIGISGLNEFTTFGIQRWAGYWKVSELMPSIKRFTVDNPTDPRSGSVESLNMEIAGLGGQAFVKGVFHTRFFFPYIKSPKWGEWVFSPGVTYGIGTSLGGPNGSELPLFERFFPGGLGGEGDVRGYEIYSLGPQVTQYNQQGVPFAVQQVGGSQELLMSAETTFPILTELGLRGALFVDSGQAYYLSQSPSLNSLQAAYGVGIRWKSPFGPIAVDVAKPINPRPNDQTTVFDFGAGAPL